MYLTRGKRYGCCQVHKTLCPNQKKPPEAAFFVE